MCQTWQIFLTGKEKIGRCKYRQFIAQAMVEGIPILSKDSAFDVYSINRIG